MERIFWKVLLKLILTFKISLTCLEFVLQCSGCILNALIVRDQVLLKKLIAFDAFFLPKFEKVEWEGAKNSAKLPVWALFIFIQDHVGLENFAKTLPKVLGMSHPLVEQQVLQLGKVDDLEGRAKTFLNPFPFLFYFINAVSSIKKRKWLILFDSNKRDKGIVKPP